MSDETTLLSCPFCGGEASVKVLEYDDDCKVWGVFCESDLANEYSHGHFVDNYATEAEAIAAWNSRADYHGYEQAAIEAWESIKAWNARATNGTLTAEQVKRIHEIIEKHWRDLPAEYDMPEATALPEYSYDWQAIADELNSRAERTCEFNIKDNMNETEGMGDVWIECSACHCAFDYFADDWLMKMSYCPSCGARKVNK